MIPKKIHYCWFGNKPLPELEVKCIESWKRNMPEYELVLWNEESFDISSNQFVKDAYDAKKYAFVTDYVRFYALYHYGGIYMDTDVEIIKPLDTFLDTNFFIGLEKPDSIQTGLIGSKANNSLIERVLDIYDTQKFYLDNGKLNMIPNPQLITPILMKEYGLIPENIYQHLLNETKIYPIDYFCAKDWQSGRILITDNTYAIHHFSGSWYTHTDKVKKRLKDLLGIRNTEHLLDIQRKLKKQFSKE